MHDLVGVREELRSPTLGRVEHDDLHGDGQGQQHQQPRPAGPVGTPRARVGTDRRDHRSLAGPAHALSRAATAARTASATTWLTSGWNTLGMM